MVAESAPADRTVAAIGWVHTAQRLGPALGPVIGGGLAHALGLRTTFLVAAGFYLAAFGLVILGYREPPRRPAPESEAGLSRFTFTSFRRVPNFVLFMGAIFALQMVDRSFGPILPIFLRDVGMAPDRVAVLAGVVFSVSAAAGAVGNQTSGWCLRRLPVGRLVPRTAVMAAVAAAVFGFAPVLWVLLVAAAVFGLGLGIATTSIYTAASLAVPVQARGLAFGYLTTAYLTALAISPVAAGLIGALNVRAVFVVDAIGLGAVAWALRRFIRPGGQP
jgi:DHA1 family multidrug resistance protein-like MFS transporter